MSLGFLTESALLPSQSKPILVDGRSHIPLKAIVAEELSKKEAAENLRGSRGKKRAIEEKRKDVFSGKNKGIERRQKQDQAVQELEDERDKREFTYMTKLKKKAEEYERLARGEKDPDSDDEDCLVDFSTKRRSGESSLPSRSSAEEASSSGGRPNSATDSREELGPDEVEITDEFGRTRRVSKKSDYYKQYKEEHKAQRVHEAFFRKKEAGGGGGDFSQPPARGGQREDDRDEEQGQWAWSRGDEEVEEKREKERRKKARREEAEMEAAKTSADGSILTQWDRKLHSQAREFLQEVITEESGKTGGLDILQQKQREKEDRRAKLRLKIKGSSSR